MHKNKAFNEKKPKTKQNKQNWTKQAKPVVIIHDW